MCRPPPKTAKPLGNAELNAMLEEHTAMAIAGEKLASTLSIAADEEPVTRQEGSQEQPPAFIDICQPCPEVPTAADNTSNLNAEAPRADLQGNPVPLATEAAPRSGASRPPRETQRAARIAATIPYQTTTVTTSKLVSKLLK